ncbi:hypothetical protein SAMD00019534_088300 [Acytostelium subglobosum LB1]|uniref:hypothetical protein n=1 Tax=Acytostelium subglobosum LB1 TaxID=1410327 RepID=UPI000645049B|nr:hypothetical protein SAMD00019534_088300 [Acytostelium subglobosum LB1]GAM25655.1 hypothetical protein SAMD00019534_088300 [Acytostelium subglobosum LB1]|eukprot:XP_012751641.1 hypothetical protein SAMD00019534_088300 [Acytostelium subglobosum LB1]
MTVVQMVAQVQVKVKEQEEEDGEECYQSLQIIIKSYLFSDVQKEEFDSQFTKGKSEIVLKNVVLDKAVLNSKLATGLPFQFGVVRIDSIEFNIPLLNITTEPIRVVVRGVEVNIIPTSATSTTTSSSDSLSSSSSSIITDYPSQHVDSSILSGTIIRELHEGEEPTMDSSILTGIRPEDNGDVFDAMQSQLLEIFSNVIVDIEKLSLFVHTPTSIANLELYMSSASFKYESESSDVVGSDNNNNNNNEDDGDDEETNNNFINDNEVKSANQQKKPKLSFDQLSVMMHRKEGSAIFFEHKKYFFNCSKVDRPNSIVFTQSSNESLGIDIEFNSPITGNFGQEQLSGLFDLIGKLSDAIAQMGGDDEKDKHNKSKTRRSSRQIDNSSSGSQVGRAVQPPKDINLRVTIPKLNYMVNLPLLEKTICTKRNFKIHLTGDNCLIMYSKQYPRHLDSAISAAEMLLQTITKTEMSFESLSISLLPDGRPESAYKCLSLRSTTLDEGAEFRSRSSRPFISIAQKPTGRIIKPIDEQIYTAKPFLTYKQPWGMKDCSIEEANRRASCIVDCQLPECSISIYKSDFECLMNAFAIQSDQPQTSTMLFLLSCITASIELRFDKNPGSMIDEGTSEFKLFTNDLDVITTIGYPSKPNRSDLFDGMFTILSLGSLDTVAIADGKEELLFGNQVDLDGIEMLTSAKQLAITQLYELTISSISFVPSMRLITDFIDWISYENKSKQLTSSSNNNINNNNNVKNDPLPMHIDLIDCTAKYYSKDLDTQLAIKFDRLGILLSPEGRSDDFIFAFSPLKIYMTEEVSTKNMFAQDYSELQPIGYSSKSPLVYLRNITSGIGAKIEFLSNIYDFEFDKHTFHLFSTIVPMFGKRLVERIILTKEEVKPIGDNIAVMMGSQIVNAQRVMEDYMGSPHDDKSSQPEIDDLEEGFEMVSGEKIMEIIAVDMHINCTFKDTASQDHVLLQAHISEILLQNFEVADFGSYTSSLKVNLSHLLIHDKIVKSPFKNLFGPIASGLPADPLNHLVSLVLLSRKDNFKRACYNVVLHVNPLYISAYKLTIDFLLDFFINYKLTDGTTNKLANVPPAAPGNDQVPTEEDTIIFDEILILPLGVKIDYRPSSTKSDTNTNATTTNATNNNNEDNNNNNNNDQPQPQPQEFSSIKTRGGYVWMFSMIPLTDANFTLPEVYLHEIPLSKLPESIMNVYQPNLSTNVFQYLTGVTPVKIFFKVGNGMFALIREPIHQASGPDGVMMGVGKGLGTGIQTLFVELLSVSTTLAQGLASFAKNFTNNTTDRTNSSIMTTQPKTFKDGTSMAVSYMIGGFYNAAKGILFRPVSKYRERGARGFLTALMWGVPGVVLSPVVGIAEGITSFSLGLRNSLDSSRMLKYKSIANQLNQPIENTSKVDNDKKKSELACPFCTQ